MKNENIEISAEQKLQISHMLHKQGLSETEINEILSGEYSTFQNETELFDLFSSNGTCQNVLRGLSDGYTIDELPQIGVKKNEIQIFLEILDKCNISIENAKAINQYSNGSNMILSIKRDNVSSEKIKNGIMADMIDKLKTRGITQGQISEIQDFMEKIDYTIPVHNNFDIVNKYIQIANIPRSCYPSICTAVKEMDLLEHIDLTISSLDDGLSKVQLPEPMKLYRAIKTNGQIQPDDYIGKVMSNKGYTSTSPLYNSSFAKYDEYDTVIEIYAPKGTQGLYITQLSDYDNVEQEVLLNSNDIYILNVQQGIIDQNGKQKTVLKGLLLSKERECYRGIDKQEKKEENQCEQKQHEDIIETENIDTNLPAKQNVFLKFFNQIKAIFLRQRSNTNQQKSGLFTKDRNNVTQYENENTEYQTQQKLQQSKSQLQENKSWKLKPEETAIIEKETAEIVKKYRSQEEQHGQKRTQIGDIKSI